MWGRGGSRGRGRGRTQQPICKDFLRTGRCERGDFTGANKCQFAHVVSGHLGAQREEFSTRECFDFVNKGVCSYGDNCKYRHQSGDKPMNENHSAFLAARAWAFAKEQKEQNRAGTKRKAQAEALPATSFLGPGDVAPARAPLPSCLVVKPPIVGPRPQPPSTSAMNGGRAEREELQAHAPAERDAAAAMASTPVTGLLGLVAYGSSESESENEDGTAGKGARDSSEGVAADGEVATRDPADG